MFMEPRKGSVSERGTAYAETVKESPIRTQQSREASEYSG